jgi:hypothetical protein
LSAPINWHVCFACTQPAALFLAEQIVIDRQSLATRSVWRLKTNIGLAVDFQIDPGMQNGHPSGFYPRPSTNFEENFEVV